MVRPTWRPTSEQRKLVSAVNKQIDRANREADAIWEVARKAREGGVPDTHLCGMTGLNRATLLRRLGPRDDPEKSVADSTDTPSNE